MKAAAHSAELLGPLALPRRQAEHFPPAVQGVVAVAPWMAHPEYPDSIAVARTPRLLLQRTSALRQSGRFVALA
jgi:hypothetical protein